jgi:hypothetical protein
LPKYLANRWQPWRAVHERLAPQVTAPAIEHRNKAMGKQFENPVQTRLHEI